MSLIFGCTVDVPAELKSTLFGAWMLETVFIVFSWFITLNIPGSKWVLSMVMTASILLSCLSGCSFFVMKEEIYGSKPRINCEILVCLMRSCCFTSACFFWMAGQFFQLDMIKLVCLPIGAVFVAMWAHAYVKINEVTNRIWGSG